MGSLQHLQRCLKILFTLRTLVILDGAHVTFQMISWRGFASTSIRNLFTTTSGPLLKILILEMTGPWGLTMILLLLGVVGETLAQPGLLMCQFLKVADEIRGWSFKLSLSLSALPAISGPADV
jgi:hypothetical protein